MIRIIFTIVLVSSLASAQQANKPSLLHRPAAPSIQLHLHTMQADTTRKWHNVQHLRQQAGMWFALSALTATALAIGTHASKEPGDAMHRFDTAGAYAGMGMMVGSGIYLFRSYRIYK